jgi:hypothetical protein
MHCVACSIGSTHLQCLHRRHSSGADVVIGDKCTIALLGIIKQQYSLD